MASRTEAPWWVAEEAWCGGCSHGYAMTAELYCTGCDRPGCLHCVLIVRATGETWCPECRPDADRADEEQAGG